MPATRAMELPRRLLPRTADRVPANTPDPVLRRIHAQIVDSVHFYARNRHLIAERLAELDREWDLERALEANAAAVILGGLLLARRVDPRLGYLSWGAAGFLLQHALQGWCPPMSLLRRLGVRTAEEIGAERMALRALRGDFNRVARGALDPDDRARAALDAVGFPSDVTWPLPSARRKPWRRWGLGVGSGNT